MHVIELSDEEYKQYEQFRMLNNKKEAIKKEIFKRKEISEEKATDYWSRASKQEFKRIYLGVEQQESIDLNNLENIKSCLFSDEAYRNSVKYYIYEKNSDIDFKTKINFVLSGTVGLFNDSEQCKSFFKEGYLIGSLKLSRYYHSGKDFYKSRHSVKALDDYVVIAEWDASAENLQIISSDSQFLTCVLNDLTDIVDSNDIMQSMLSSSANKRVCLAGYALYCLRHNIDITNEGYWIPKGVKIQQSFNWKYLTEVRRILLSFCQQGILEEVRNPNIKSISSAYFIKNENELKKISGLNDEEIESLSRLLRV